jgi:hypothetical protein
VVLSILNALLGGRAWADTLQTQTIYNPQRFTLCP